MAWMWKRVDNPNGRCARYIAVNTCEKCGVEFRSNNPSSTKYCPECGKQIRAQQNRDRVRRYRERLKQQNA